MKEFITETDIEDLFKSGTRSLRIGDDVVLTELAYEHAKKLGIRLLTDGAESPPSAPVRPYLAEKEVPRSVQLTDSVAPSLMRPLTDSSREHAVVNRIRAAVVARLGNQIDAKLLDTIILRVIKATGVK
jgi:hypothetical protein